MSLFVYRVGNPSFRRLTVFGAGRRGVGRGDLADEASLTLFLGQPTVQLGPAVPVDAETVQTDHLMTRARTQLSRGTGAHGADVCGYGAWSRLYTHRREKGHAPADISTR